MQVLTKASWTTFEFRNFLSALRFCHVTIIWGVVYKESMIFEVFGAYLSEFLIFPHQIFLGSKTLPSSCGKHQKFDHGFSWDSKFRFCRFLTILSIFRAVCFGTSLYPRTLIFLWKISTNYVLSRIVRDYSWYQDAINITISYFVWLFYLALGVIYSVRKN